MGFFTASILGFVQGVTEFLPISSTGHLILARSFLEVVDSHALAFDAVLQMATVCAVVVYFWRDLWALVQAFLRYVGRLPVNARDINLVWALLVGTIPAVIVGLLLEDMMEVLFRSPLLVAGVLVLGSGLFMLAEVMYAKRPPQKEISIQTGFLIGLFQTLALIPGMSRSGATIAGGMLLGLSRVEATRFGFLLAIPVILGAGLKKLFELLTVGAGEVAWPALVAGAGIAFVVGLGAIHFMIRFVRTHTLWPFIWYRIALAAVVILALYY
jgi:undecaprenyl-diphosphatase